VTSERVAYISAENDTVQYIETLQCLQCCNG
jgi:hypothetical protein